jgi:hypothetical protein
MVIAIREFIDRPDNNDVLYLQAAIPHHPTDVREFRPQDCTSLSPRLMRVNRCSDLSGSAAYVVRPRSAASLIRRVLDMGTNGADAHIHHGLNEGRLGVVVMKDYRRGFMLNDHWSEWNHVHNPQQT